jgi:arylsulfatase
MTTSPFTPLGSVLPLPQPASPARVGASLQESAYQKRERPMARKADAPNIVIIMLDDAGYAQADTVGGPIHTPTLTRIADSGVRYNAFHTTAVCSATRASLLTGRNHHRVGNGIIAEFASDWDGYTAEIPKSCATIAEVLQAHGYRTAAFGKWHNTPVSATTSMGPFDRWPTGHGFDYFYGFIGGETSQYEPRLYRNTTPVEPPHDPTYHLTEDLVADAIRWLREREAHAPDEPFFLYWTPGAVHAPHHVFKEWSDKYKGQFDDGWDAYREKAFARQKTMGFIPADAEITQRHAGLPAWDTLSENERRFQARLMEVFAGFLEHTDVQAGKLVDELERQGLRDNTLIFYVFSDNGSSAEGMTGTLAELNSQNGIPNKPAQHMALLDKLGGLDALGSARFDNHYHAAWGWAGMTPFQGTKLVAGYFGGTRVPLAISWPSAIQPDPQVRPQFHHVNDIAATIYEVIGVPPPQVVHGHAQEPLDGVSMCYTFGSATAPGTKQTQYFEVLGSRGIFHQGWMASVWGPRTPWVADNNPYKGWNPHNDTWALYHVEKDFSQARDLAAQEPERLEDLKRRFDAAARENHVYPLGAGLWTLMHPEDRSGPGERTQHFTAAHQRVPEVMAPNLRARNSVVRVEVETKAAAEGVLYALGGIAGGVSLYMADGHVVYEYNALMLKRTAMRAPQPLQPGRHVIEVHTTMVSKQLGTPGRLSLHIDGEKVAEALLFYTVPMLFTATETFNVGKDLGSPVVLDYFDRAPFPFNGVIRDLQVSYPHGQ